MKSTSTLIGTTAMASANALRVLIQLVSLPIIGRILGPHAYGQIALVSPFIYFSMLIAESGLSACIVRAERLTPDLEGTIFTFSACFSLFIIALFGALAYPLGVLLHEPKFPHLLIGMSSMLLLASLNVVPAGLLLRAKKYQWMALSDFVSAIGGITAVTIGICLDWGTWSLVAQEITFWLCKVIVVTIGSSCRPRLRFHWDIIKQNIQFSANLTGTSLLTFFNRNIDNILIGAVRGSEALGYYALAFQAVGFPQMVFAGSVYYTLFSGTSEAARAGTSTSMQFLKALRGILLISAPVMVGLATTAPLSVPLLLGDKWLPMVTLIMFLMPYGIAQTIGAATSGILVGLGLTNFTLRLTILSAIMTLIAIACGIYFSIDMVALGVSVAALINCGLTLRIVIRECHTNWKRVLEAMAGPLIASFVMGVVVIGLQHVMPDSLLLIIRLLTCILVGICIYGLVLFGFFRDHLASDIGAIKTALQTRLKKK